MIQRTVSGAVIDPKAKAESSPNCPIWEACDGWGKPIRFHTAKDNPCALVWLRAIDATAAAELFAQYLVDHYDLEESTFIDVRAIGGGDWIRVEVMVELRVEVEISARRIVRRRVKA